MNNEEKATPTVTPIDDEVEISKEHFSKLSYRQKFAVSEYGYLLSVEDAETVGKMLGSITKEKDILPFCQARGKRVLNFDESRTITNTYANWPLIGLLAGLIPGLIFFVLLFLIWNNDEVFYLICFGSVGIPCGLIGAAIGRRSKKAAWIGAVLGAVLGAGLWFLFVINTCLLCQ